MVLGVFSVVIPHINANGCDRQASLVRQARNARRKIRSHGLFSCHSTFSPASISKNLTQNNLVAVATQQNHYATRVPFGPDAGDLPANADYRPQMRKMRFSKGFRQ
jgi:hypothetical protein